MEFERSFYRLYEYVLNSANLQKLISIIYYVSLICSIILFVVLWKIHSFFVGKSQINIENMIESKDTHAQRDTNKSIYSLKSSYISDLKVNSLNNTVDYIIYFFLFENKNDENQFDLYLEKYDNELVSPSILISNFSKYIELLVYSNKHYVLQIPENQRKYHNISIYYKFLQKSNIIPNTLISIISSFFQCNTEIYLNQFLYSNLSEQGNLFILLTNTTYSWEISRIDLSSNYLNQNLIKQITSYLFIKILLLILSIFTYSFLSLTISLLTKLGIYSSCVFIVWINEARICCNRRINLESLFRLIPWIGLYASYLKRTNRNLNELLLSYWLTFIFSYFILNGIMYIWIDISSDSHFISLENISNYFSSIMLLEIWSFIFIRTRISLKYCPKFISLINILFLFYYFSFPQPLFFLSFLLCISLQAFTLTYFIKYVELKSLSWNPFNPFTPSNENPRQCYIPICLKDYNFGNDLWTAFYIYSFRSEFTTNEQNFNSDSVSLNNFDFRIEENEDNAMNNYAQNDNGLEMRIL